MLIMPCIQSKLTRLAMKTWECDSYQVNKLGNIDKARNNKDFAISSLGNYKWHYNFSQGLKVNVTKKEIKEKELDRLSKNKKDT